MIRCRRDLQLSGDQAIGLRCVAFTGRESADRRAGPLTSRACPALPLGSIALSPKLWGRVP